MHEYGTGSLNSLVWWEQWLCVTCEGWCFKGTKQYVHVIQIYTCMHVYTLCEYNLIFHWSQWSWLAAATSWPLLWPRGEGGPMSVILSISGGEKEAHGAEVAISYRHVIDSDLGCARPTFCLPSPSSFNFVMKGWWAAEWVTPNSSDINVSNVLRGP